MAGSGIQPSTGLLRDKGDPGHACMPHEMPHGLLSMPAPRPYTPLFMSIPFTRTHHLLFWPFAHLHICTHAAEGGRSWASRTHSQPSESSGVTQVLHHLF